MRDHHGSGFGASAVIFYTLFTFTAMTCAGTYSGGSGTPDDPYKISSVADWQELIATSTDWNKNFILINDIDFGELILTPIGNTKDKFTGNFDGNGFTLSNLNIYQPEDWYVGLFGYVSFGKLYNLGLDNYLITGYRNVGGICGYNYKGMIENCHSDGNIDGGGCMGGICGYNKMGTIVYSNSEGIIEGGGGLGGLCGINELGSIRYCFTQFVYVGGGTYFYNTQDCGGLCGSNTGTISNCHSYSITVRGGDSNIGGLCGYNSGTISNSSCPYRGVSSDDVLGWIADSIGGLCGRNIGTIYACYSSNSVTGWSNSNNIGGLCGSNGGIISDCYATGRVYGYNNNNIGGLCGINEQDIIRCYSVGLVKVGESSKYYGGLCGLNGGVIKDSYWNNETVELHTSDGGWSLTDTQMRDSANYFGWNTQEWIIDDGFDYPHLAWENSLGNIISTDYPARTYTGSGLVNDPFRICTPEDLVCLGLRMPDWSSHFILDNDIDMAEISNFRPILILQRYTSSSFMRRQDDNLFQNNKLNDVSGGYRYGRQDDYENQTGFEPIFETI